MTDLILHTLVGIDQQTKTQMDRQTDGQADRQTGGNLLVLEWVYSWAEVE